MTGVQTCALPISYEEHSRRYVEGHTETSPRKLSGENPQTTSRGQDRDYVLGRLDGENEMTPGKAEAEPLK